MKGILVDMFPKYIDVSIKDTKTNENIKNVAISITLFALKKNNYTFILPINKNDGHIQITKEWLINEIKKEQNLFPMDYSCSIEECERKIELKILNEKEVTKAVDALKLFKDYLGVTNDDILSLAQVENYIYQTSSKIVQLNNASILNIELQTTKS